MTANIKVLYNRLFFDKMYKDMCDNQLDTLIDESGTLWHIDHVEDILVDEFGYRITAGGIVV